jgi:hypothetical protein
LKNKIGHICANAIIYRAAKPEEILVDIKTADYPLAVWRGCFCFIGGNWTGNAFADQSPKDTFLREMREELQLIKHTRSTAELGETAIHANPGQYRVKGIDRQPTVGEENMLNELKKEIEKTASHFNDCILTIPRDVFTEADPQSTQTTQVALLSVFEAGLDETAWSKLAELQQRFGNVSCESESQILTMDEIVKKGIFGLSGQDRILQQFFEDKGVTKGRRIPMKPGIIVEPIYFYLGGYRNYLYRYDIERRPTGW